MVYSFLVVSWRVVTDLAVVVFLVVLVMVAVVFEHCLGIYTAMI